MKEKLRALPEGFEKEFLQIREEEKRPESPISNSHKQPPTPKLPAQFYSYGKGDKNND